MATFLFCVALATLVVNQTQIHYTQTLKVCSDMIIGHVRAIQTNQTVLQQIEEIGMGCFAVRFLEPMDGAVLIFETQNDSNNVVIQVRSTLPNLLRVDGVKYVAGKSVCYNNAYCNRQSDEAFDRIIQMQKNFSTKITALARRQMMYLMGVIPSEKEFQAYNSRLENAQFLAAELIYCLSCAREEITSQLLFNSNSLQPIKDLIEDAYAQVGIKLDQQTVNKATTQLLSVYNEPWFNGFTDPASFSASIQAQTSIVVDGSESGFNAEKHLTAIRKSGYFYENDLRKNGDMLPGWAIGLIMTAVILVIAGAVFTAFLLWKKTHLKYTRPGDTVDLVQSPDAPTKQNAEGVEDLQQTMEIKFLSSNQ